MCVYLTNTKQSITHVYILSTELSVAPGSKDLRIYSRIASTMSPGPKAGESSTRRKIFLL